MSEAVTVAAIMAVPGLLGSFAAIMAAKNTKNGRGPVTSQVADVQDRLARMEIHLSDMLRWQVDHVQSHLN